MASVGPRQGEAGDDEVWIEVAGVERPAGGAGGAASGTVISCGTRTRELLDARVLVPGLLPCGTCPTCRRGWVTACPAAHRLRDELGAPPAAGDFTAPALLCVPAGFLCRLEGPIALPEGEPLAPLALIAGAALRVHHALSRAGAGPNELVVLIGAGPEADFGHELAKARGASAIAVEPGCVPAEAMAAVAAEAARREVALPWRIVEATGEAAGIALAARLCSAGGTLSLLHPRGTTELPLLALAALEVTVQPCGDAHPDLLPELVALALKGEIGAHRRAVLVGPGRASAIAAEDRLVVFVP
jgi:threonine dehydrogenase-like Zn-dependent dehydrogenase